MPAPTTETLETYLASCQRALVDHERIIRKRGQRDVKASTLNDDYARLRHIGALLSICQRLHQQDPGRAVTPEMSADYKKKLEAEEQMILKLRFCLLAIRAPLHLPDEPENPSLIGMVDETYKAILPVSGFDKPVTAAEAREMSDATLDACARLKLFGVEIEAEYHRRHTAAPGTKQPGKRGDPLPAGSAASSAAPRVRDLRD